MQFGSESLLPPVVAILLAIATRKVILPLATGVLIGAMLLASANQEATWTDAPILFAASMTDSIFATSHLQVAAFTLLMGAMVGVMESGGGMHALIARMSRYVRSRRAGQTMIVASGLMIFFDDYANSLLVGGTMRSTADRFGISREKLAYLVDSTAAPVAGLSLISTWAAVEIDYIATGLAKIEIDDPTAALTMFMRSIPYRFYAWYALAMVFVVALTGRDIGGMQKAEQAAVADNSNAQQCSQTDRNDQAWLWSAAVFPVIGCILAVVLVLVVSGIVAMDAGESRSSGKLWLAIEVLGNGDPYIALIIGSGLGLVLTMILHGAIGAHSLAKLFWDAARGAWQMMSAITILWFAWALSAMTDEDQLNSGVYLASLLSDQISAVTLPTIVFVIAGFVAFATGTSWGTMAILTPLSIELAFRLVGDTNPNNEIILATCGSVLAGAIFGDHCSPISDTTVLSSRASGCDHVAHVRTQIPYALIAGGVSVLLGTLPVSLGLSPWVALTGGIGCLYLIVRWVGRPVAQSNT